MPTAMGRALKSTGMRVTSQRSIIMDIIRQGHLDADEIYRRARKKEPRISLSTVYRALQAFKKLGLIEEVHFDDAHHHYELKPSEEHYHLVCLKCGKVVEFQYPLNNYIRRNIPEVKDFDITETELRIAGYCSECRRKQR
jgi:Fe2+ or Zn2+ uptake regulation protein